MRNKNPARPDPNHTTLTVDPALHGLAVAWWAGRELVVAGYLPHPKGTRHGGVRGPQCWWELNRVLLAWLGDLRPDTVVVEQQQVYGKTSRTKADPADLLELAGVAGTVATVARQNALGYFPAVWKGSAHNEAQFAALIARAFQTEYKHWASRAGFTGAASDKDIAHAIGLGLFHFGLPAYNF